MSQGVAACLPARTPEARAFAWRRPFAWILVALQSHGVDLGFASYALLVAVQRFSVLVGPGAPPGIDGGNWLAFGHALVGERIRAGSISYPPLVPLATSGLVGVVGPTAGVSLVAVLASLVPAGAAYAVLRGNRLGWKGAVAAAFLLPATSTGEAVAWGGYPQLIGLGLTLVFLWRLDAYLRSAARRDLWAVGVFLFADAATSHLTTFAALLAAGLVVLLHAAFRWRAMRPLAGRMARDLALACLPCLVLAPVYLHLAAGLAAPPAATARTGMVASVEALYRDFPALWRAGLVFALVAPLLLWRHRRSPLWILTTALLVTAVAPLLVLREPRFVYLLPPAVVLAVGCILLDVTGPGRRTTPWVAPVVGVLLAAVVAAQTISGLRFFAVQRRYYGIQSVSTFRAVSWVSRRTPRGSTIAVTPVNGAPLGWWVEGLGRRRTLSGSLPKWLNYPDERSRAALSNRIFGRLPSTAALSFARSHGVDYLFIAKDWEGYVDHDVAAFVRNHRSLVAFETRSVVLVRTRD